MKPTETKYQSSFYMLVFFMLIFFSNNIFCQKIYTLNYQIAGKDSSNKIQQLGLKTLFESKDDATLYINKLPATLLSKGFPAASVDSVLYDSASAIVKIYPGQKYTWAQISTDSIDPFVLDQTGWNEKQFENKEMDFYRLQSQQHKILEYYENNGYPLQKFH